MNWDIFWTAVGSVAAALAVLGPLLLFGARLVKQQLQKEIQPVKEENLRLRDDLNTRLRLPSFGLDAIRLTEAAAQRKVEELELKYEQAVRDKDRELSDTLSEQLREIALLRERLAILQTERNQLQTALESNLIVPRRHVGKNAVELPTGFILVVRHAGYYGAVKAVEQSSSKRGAFIRYVWWYQPDGSGSFINANVQRGFGETTENGPYPRPTPMLEIGPIRLEWSVSAEGSGWVYFGPSSTPSPDYELVVTNEVDISKVNGEHLRFSQARI